MNGIHYVISGGGGGKLSQRVRRLPNTVTSEGRHHAVFLEIDEAGLTLEAVDVDGEVFDRLELTPQG